MPDLPATMIRIPFAGGLDEKTAAEWLDPTQRQAKIVNGNFTKTGAIDKRLGVKALGTSILPSNVVTEAFTNPKRIAATKRSGTLIFTEDAVYNYSTAENALAGLSQMPNVDVKRVGIPGDANSSAPMLCDFGGSLRMSAFVTNDVGNTHSVAVTIFDRDTGEIALQPHAIDSGLGGVTMVGCFLIDHGAHIVIIYNVLATDYWFVRYDVDAKTFSARVGIPRTATFMDATPFIGDPAGGFLVAWVSSATGHLSYDYLLGDGTFVSTTAVETAHAVETNLSIYGTYDAGGNEFVWVGYVKTITGLPNTYAWTMQSFLGDGTFAHVSTVACFTFATLPKLSGITRVDASRAWQSGIVTAHGAGDDTVAWGIQARARFNGVAPYKTEPWPATMLPVGKPFSDGTGGDDGPVIMPVLAGTDKTLYLVKFTANLADHALPIATSCPRIVSGVTIYSDAFFSGAATWPFMSCGAVNTQPERAALGVPVQVSANQVALFASDYAFEQDRLFKVDELGDGAHIQAGVPMTFDGTTCFEKGFFYTPVVYTSTAGTGISGTYDYRVIFRRTDANGNVHRSIPAVVPQLVGVANKTITLHISVMSMSWGDETTDTPVFADVYRTVAGGATFFYVGSVRATPPSAAPANSSANWVTFADNHADGVISTNQLLYTTGGVLDSVNPPAFRAQAVHKNRLWAVDETGTIVWFTSEFLEGEAVAWNEETTQELAGGGSMTALDSLDDAFLMAKEDELWVMFGDGPSRTGAGSDLTQPQRLASDVGVVDWRSVVLFSGGIIFRARKGFFLLTRARAVTYIGKAVEDTLAAFPTVTSATLCADVQQIRFTCSNGSESIVIAYDYFHNAWTTHAYAQLVGDIVSASLYADRFAFVTDDGFVWSEREESDVAAYLDEDTIAGTHFVETSITSAWVKIQGVQGYQRARRALLYGERMSAHGFEIDFAVNDDPTVQQVATFADTALTRDQVQVHVGATLNKEMSIQITVMDTAPAVLADNGQGCRFVSLDVEIQQLGPRFRQIPATSSA